MKKTLVLSLFVASALLGVETDAFKTHTELSYVNTQGNTDTNAFSVDLSGEKTWSDHKVKLDVDALYGDDNGIETRNKIVGEFNYDYTVAGSFSINYLFGYKYDRFSGYEHQLYTGPGLKYGVLSSDAHKLNVQANMLYSQDQTMKKYYDASGSEIKYPYPDGKDGVVTVEKSSSDDYTAYVIKGDYTWQIMESLKFLQEASYRGDAKESKRYFAYSKTAIESKLSDMFSLGVSYKVDYTNEPPSGNERSDRTFMTSLIIDY